MKSPYSLGRRAAFLAAAASLLILAGCGQKGPLYMPVVPPDPFAPPKPVQSRPANSKPEASKPGAGSEDAGKEGSAASAADAKPAATANTNAK